MGQSEDGDTFMRVIRLCKKWRLRQLIGDSDRDGGWCDWAGMTTWWLQGNEDNLSNGTVIATVVLLMVMKKMLMVVSVVEGLENCSSDYGGCSKGFHLKRFSLNFIEQFWARIHSIYKEYEDILSSFCTLQESESERWQNLIRALGKPCHTGSSGRAPSIKQLFQVDGRLHSARRNGAHVRCQVNSNQSFRL